MKNLSFYMITILICSACSSIKSQSQNEIQFKPLNLTLKDAVSEQFNVVFKADTMQRVSSAGLKFSIKIYNKSEKTATVINPMDGFRLSLISEKGINILYPHTAKITVHAPPGTKFPFVAFNVLKIEVNGKKRNDDLEVIKDIEIPGKGSYEIFFSITKSLKAEAVKPYKIEDTVKLPKGRYNLKPGLSINKNIENQRFTVSTQINYGI